ncbi:HAD family phosphatase [Cytophaga sp. FL35]|uniref:HAD family hydrolase n=1 Tax=Cytophaga sp. FL35 TaxID=1904456 RepID=UPI0016539FFA|nr:HAD family phosphatase [Cytophaga sp. FL35]MBC6998914.1 HAD family phosphatase [Cytophaga sp. FL35]
MKFQKKTTTIIFDMNGVITDDEHCHEMATKLVFETFAVDITPEIYRTYCLGRTDKAAFADLLADFGLQYVKCSKLIADKTKIYLDLVSNELKIYPGVVACIEKLAQNYTLALTTSSTKLEVQATMKITGLSDLFKVVVTSEDVSRGKPDPEPYLVTLKKLGLPASQCLVIEDSENGVKSAKAAGIRCIAISNTEISEKLQLADAIIKSYKEFDDNLIQSLCE